MQPSNGGRESQLVKGNVPNAEGSALGLGFGEVDVHVSGRSDHLDAHGKTARVHPHEKRGVREGLCGKWLCGLQTRGQ